MLVLSRKVGEEIVLPEHGVTIGVVAVNGRRVRLGIKAPSHIPVLRGELLHRMTESLDGADDSGDPDGEPSPMPIADGDDDWQEAVKRKIAARTHGSVLVVDVDVVEGRLVLQGRARSYYGKQLACAAALELLDTPESTPFTHVELDIDVHSDP
ncbi:MAG: hypothetical protein FJ276_09185 [Planctomycetes bacterium]|nr:hypothetical protein [Planctomycetota bacterium]